jgi:hypothetical protein
MWELSESETQEQTTLKTQINLNLALCQLKTSQFADVIKSCDKVCGSLMSRSRSDRFDAR